MSTLDKYDLIYQVIAAIPRGRVASYGQIAAMAGLPRNARMVGRALRALPGTLDLPWHRVVNHQGGISPRGGTESERDQRALLEAEGVTFTGERVRMALYQWESDEVFDE
jgi:methylated-DNA-protein-cysteine methyltransferase-like protein